METNASSVVSIFPVTLYVPGYTYIYFFFRPISAQITINASPRTSKGRTEFKSEIPNALYIALYINEYINMQVCKEVCK